jgi:hypothetical protein
MSAEDYDVIPINNSCTKETNNLLLSNKPGSNVADATNSINTVNYQQKVYSQYDTNEEIDIKPMYGGLKNKNINKIKYKIQFKIQFKNKNYEIISDKIENAIKNLLNNRIWNSDQILIVNDKDIYIIKGKYKNKFRKV